MNIHAEPQHYDVLLLGGGPAGTATALALSKHAPHLRVAVVEQSAYDCVRVGETLPPIVQPLLEQLGVWPAFKQQGHMPAYGTCAAWGSDELIENPFIYHPYNTGWHLDRCAFDRMLADSAAQRGVQVLVDAQITHGPVQHAGRWHATICIAQQIVELEAPFVVDATGKRALFASRQGARRVFFDRLLGVVMFFSFAGAPPTDSYSLVEADADGWWYSTVLPDGRLIVACMRDADDVQRQHLRSEAHWFTALSTTQHTRQRVGNGVACGPPTIHVAYSHRLDRLTGNAWLAVGDAAAAVDPLTSQGMYKALHSGILAAYAVIDFFGGMQGGLQRYEALQMHAFEDYLRARMTYYRDEQRWAQSRFWQRRHGYITLDPQQVLHAIDGNKPLSQATLTMHLRAADLEFLCSLCHVPRPAYEIIAIFQQLRRSEVSDERIILALQYLVEQGIIVVGEAEALMSKATVQKGV